MSQILVHAGPDKTGTTAIQRFCSRNTDFLRRFNIEYPCSESTYNHRWLTAAFLADKSLLPITRRCDDQVIGHRTHEARKLVEHVAGNQEREVVLLSHEGLHVLAETELESYRDFLFQHDNHVRLLYYVRDPLDYARSAMSQRVLGGRDPLKPAIPLLDHQAILTKYVKVFGKDQLDVRVYREDVLTDFLVQIGIDRAIAMRSVPDDYRENPGLSATGLEVGAKLIQMAGEFDAARVWFRSSLADKLREIPGPPICLTKEQVREIEQRSRVCMDYLAGEFGIEFPGGSSFTVNRGETSMETTRIARKLFDEYFNLPDQGAPDNLSLHGSVDDNDPAI